MKPTTPKARTSISLFSGLITGLILAAASRPKVNRKPSPRAQRGLSPAEAMDGAKRTRVLVLGGGFAGWYAARTLAPAIPSTPGLEVTLIDCEDFLLFTPMLHEVAASDIDAADIVVPLLDPNSPVRVVRGDINEIDLAAKRVTVVHAFSSHAHVLEGDFLVLALGATSNFYDLPGIEENAITMKALEDAFYLRSHVIRRLEGANLDGFENSAASLTFVVCGGGFAGVETVGALVDFLEDAAEDYPDLRREMIHTVLLHAEPELLPELGTSLGAYARQKLRERGVQVLVNAKVTGYRDGAVMFEQDGAEHRIPTNTLVWTAGVKPSPVLATLPAQNVNGRLLTTPSLELPEWPGVYAVGDCAAIPHPGRPGNFYGPTAQNGLRQGKRAGRNILRTLRGQAPLPFRYRELGQLAAIGQRRGVANVLGFHFSGFLAWWLWRMVYLWKLPGISKKVRVAFDWTLDIFLRKDSVTFYPPHIPAMDRPQSAGVAGEKRRA